MTAQACHWPDEDRSSVNKRVSFLRIIPTTLLVIATISVAMRITARTTKRWMDYDDYVMAVI